MTVARPNNHRNQAPRAAGPRGGTATSSRQFSQATLTLNRINRRQGNLVTDAAAINAAAPRPRVIASHRSVCSFMISQLLEIGMTKFQERAVA